jgi:serine-type D-Ala-D-Ala carboxypeptidase/endopeptidase (penicillin-binding protein 4)
MRSCNKPYIVTVLLPLLLLSCSRAPQIAVDPEAQRGRPGAPVETRVKKSQIEYQLHNLFKREEFNRTVPSIIVLSADYGDTVFSHQSDFLVRPASNQKIVTSAAALRILGANYCFRTIVYRAGDIHAGTLHGDIIIKGYGDPLLRLTDLDEIADALRLFGIREIDGNIVVDDSYFDAVHWPSGWMWDDEPNSYVPYISALSINSNVVRLSVGRDAEPGGTLAVEIDPPTTYIQYELAVDHGQRVGDDELRIIPDRLSGNDRYLIKGDPQKLRLPRTFTVTVRDPAVFAGYLLYDKLADRDIRASGSVIRGDRSPSAIPLIQINTPLDSVLHAMNKTSDNLAAEAVWKTLSAEVFGPPGTGGGGQKAVRMALEEYGIESSHFNLIDGSGVSFYNLVTMRAIANLLVRLREDGDSFPLFYNSLSVMGVDGTLVRRAMHSPARGRVRAKTGTLTGVSSLSGYIETYSDEMLVVAMSFQNFTIPSGRYRQIQDEICELLLHFDREASVLTTPLPLRRAN